MDLARILLDYYDKETQRIKIIPQYKVEPITLEVLLNEIKKVCLVGKKKELRAEYIDEAIRVVDTEVKNAEYIKQEVIDFGRKSALYQAIINTVQDLEQGNIDYEKIEGNISKATRIGENLGNLGMDFYSGAEQRALTYTTHKSDGVKRIPTGLSGIDKVLHGGLGGGELGVIIAPPNKGKSLSLMNIGAGAMENGYNVCYISLEMREAQIMKRFDMRLMNKNFDNIKLDSNKIVQSILAMKKAKMGNVKIKKFPSGTCTTNTIRAYLTQLMVQEGFKPHVLLVDYGDLVQSLRTYKDKRNEIESVYLNLRDLAEELDIPVWTASQTNRGGLDKKIITIADLAEDFSKAMTSDFMWAFCQSDDEKKDEQFRCYIAKAREGGAGMMFDGDISYDTLTMKIPDIEL